jgi:lysophospholipase L1-like esterase
MLRFLVALWHVVGILLLAVLAVEFGVEGWRRLSRYLRYRRPTPPDRTAAADAYAGADWAGDYLDEFRRGVRLDWRPYVEWWQRPFRGGQLTIDERGLRPTPGECCAPEDALRILCFGGSTMMGMGARDDHTIAAVLARRLGELGHRVRVTNYGQLGHNSTQETITLQQLLKSGGRIDVAVFYDGVNEMACAEQTGRADAVFDEARRRQEFNLLYSERRRELMLAGLAAAVPRTLRRLRRLTGLPLRSPLTMVPADLSQIDIARLARDVIKVYCANLRLVRALARAYGFTPVFFWQPAIASKTAKTADEERWAREHIRDPEARARLHGAVIAERRRCRELAEAGDAVDLSALFDRWSDPVYIDLYHLSEAGNAAVAEAMLPAVAAAADMAAQRRRGE